MQVAGSPAAGGWARAGTAPQMFLRFVVFITLVVALAMSSHMPPSPSTALHMFSMLDPWQAVNQRQSPMMHLCTPMAKIQVILILY